MYSIFAIYVLTPFLLGFLSRYRGFHGASSIGVFRYIHARLSQGELVDRLACSFWFLVYWIFLGGFYILDKGFGFEIVRVFCNILILISCGVSLRLAYIVYDFAGVYKKHPFIFGMLCAVSVPITLTLSAVWADGYISNVTKISGTDFVTGMAVLGFLLSPLSWAFLFSILFMGPYAYAWGKLTSKKSTANAYSGVGLTPSKHQRVTAVSSFSDFVHASCVFGLAINALAPLLLLGNLLSNQYAERFLSGALYFSSFHVEAKACGSEYERGRVKFLPDNLAVLGIYDKSKGYVFSKIECKN